MNLNEKAKKIVAMMGIIEDTESEIKRLKAEIEQRIGTLLAERQQQCRVLNEMLGRVEGISTSSMGSEYAAIKRRVEVYLGRLILHGNEEENGKTS